MLVVSRKVGERVQIGKDVWVTVVRIAPGKVRLGIEAPDRLRILREEIAAEPIAEPAEEQSGSSGLRMLGQLAIERRDL